MNPWAISIGNPVEPGPNQDACSFDVARRAGAVLDGLAGHPGSEHASALAITAITDQFGELDSDWMGWAERTLYQARAQLQIARREAPKDRQRMTCAAILAARTDTNAQLAWCGDCRAYLLPVAGLLRRLTHDHDLIFAQESSDRISPTRADGIRAVLDEAQTASEAYHRGGTLAKKAFRHSHTMVSELSSGPISTLNLDLNPSDTIVLTSDGIHDCLPLSEMRDLTIPLRFMPEQIGPTLITAAQKRGQSGEGRGHPDDVTCVVLAGKPDRHGRVELQTV
jgi:serine/threonine protein phosphatase PrpC